MYPKWLKSIFGLFKSPGSSLDKSKLPINNNTSNSVDSPSFIKLKNRKPSRDNPIFGVPLPSDLNIIHPDEFYEKHFINGIPIVIYTVIKYLLRKGLDTEGIFRIPASQSELEAIKQRYDKGEKVDYDNDKICSSPHVPAGVLKKYLRDLPEPLLTFESYETLKTAYSSVKDPEQRLIRLRSVMDLLPPLNYDCLSLLSHFLKIVSENSNINKMTVVNLSICLAPNVIREEKQEESFCLLNSPNATLIMKTLIDECDSLFPGVSDSIIFKLQKSSSILDEQENK